MSDMSDTLRRTFRRLLGRENRREAIRPGRLDYIHDFTSAILQAHREVTIYLPPGYDERPEIRYPVLFMHDGQNLFEAERAFIPGQHWRLAEAADAAIGARNAEPLIIVGVDNGGADRGDEYTPSYDPKRKMGGKAGDHARMLIEELKPLIDTNYRTIPDPKRTGIGGSSLGGLVAMYLVLRHPAVFGRAAVMSPSVWWDDRMILEEVDRFQTLPRPRLWLDIGGREGREALVNVRLLRDRLRAGGWDEENFRYYEDRRGDHSERAWAARSRMMLEFLYPA